MQKRRAKSGPEIPEQLKSMFEQACEHLRSEQRINFKTFNFQHEENFAKPGEVGRTKFETHKIKLKDETPIKEAPRRIILFKSDVLDEEIQKLEEKNLLEKSTSPWTAQTVLEKKKDGSWRMCVDYSRLNGKTIKDAYQIPRINDSLDALSGSNWFTSFD